MPKAAKANSITPTMRPDFLAFWDFWQTLPPALPWEVQLKYVNIMCSEASSPTAKQAARQWLIKHNQRLVARLVWQKQAKASWANHDMQDVFTEGVLGLITAIDKYDPSKAKLSTYATWWIMQAINRFLQTNRLVYLPCHVGEMHSAIFTTAGRLRSQGKSATFDLIYAEMVATSKRTISRKRFDNALAIVSSPVSLSAQIEPGPGHSGENVGDMESMLYESAVPDDYSSILAQYLLALPELERRILSKRFGLAPYKEPMSSRAIAQSEGLAAAWICKVSNRGLHQIRHWMRVDGYEFTDFQLEPAKVGLYKAV